MEETELVEKITAIDMRSKRNEERIARLETGTGALAELAASVKLMAERLGVVQDSVKKIDGRLAEVEQQPAKRWQFVVEKAIDIAVAAVLGFVFARIGLGG